MAFSSSISLRSLALLGVMAGALTLCACGGGGDDSADSTPAEEPADGLTQAQAATAWVPHVTDTWQWQLSGTINTSYDVKVYDIDLFDAPDSVLATLRSQGKHIVCYFSAGSAENWRPDYSRFKASDKGNALDGWAGERWVDTRSANVRSIMKARLDKAKARGCDGVEPDNVDAYQNNPGFPLTAQTQLSYNRFLANEAHARGLKVGLKNDVDQLSALAPSFDFAVNEQCNQYGECGGYTVFTRAGKPVFNAEYKAQWRTDANARAQMCAKARAMNLRTMVLPLNLDDAFRYSCD
ncbi:endo alpha-1,4 polygalactosaminidase [Ideonella sp. YS5]|uniref:endo alpha-1,4 polygalactosaminidase n=1 Tax=Ideonella sp. YS5 TaxID=3453714 RepID=UPI003EEE7750